MIPLGKPEISNADIDSVVKVFESANFVTGKSDGYWTWRHDLNRSQRFLSQAEDCTWGYALLLWERRGS